MSAVTEKINQALVKRGMQWVTGRIQMWNWARVLWLLEGLWSC